MGEGGAKKTNRGQSASQGKQEPEQEQEQEQQGGTPLTCVTEPVKVACVSGCPATSISIRSDGTRLAVGTVNGAVVVYRLPGFAKVGLILERVLLRRHRRVGRELRGK